MTKEFLTKKNVLALLGLVLVAVTLPLATILVQQRQEVRKEAAACPIAARIAVDWLNNNATPGIIDRAVTGQVVKAKLTLTSGGVDAADIVVLYNKIKMHLDGANGGAISSYPPDSTNVERVLFTIQKGATAAGPNAPVTSWTKTLLFTVLSATAGDTTQITFDPATMLALNGSGGGGTDCAPAKSLLLNRAASPTNTPGAGATATPTILATCGNGVLDAGEVCDKRKNCITGKTSDGTDGLGCMNACIGGSNGYSGYPNSGRSLFCKNDCSGYREGNSLREALECWSMCTADPAAARARWGTGDSGMVYVGDPCPSGGFMNASCQCVASLPTNTPVPTATATPTRPAATNTPVPAATATPTTPLPTATPTLPAGTASFSLTPGSGQVGSGTFSLNVRLDPGGISTNNFKIAYKFDGTKLDCSTSAMAGVYTTCNDNADDDGVRSNPAQPDSYIVFDSSEGATVNAATNVGTATFTFKDSNKSANITYDRAADKAGTLKYVYVLNAAKQGVPVSVSDYCYFMTGGTCGPTGTPTPTIGGPTATPTPTVPACTKSTFPDAAGAANGDPDGRVDLLDFQRWREEFTGGLTTKTADFNCPPNGVVDLLDFNIWREYFVGHQ